MIDVVSFLDFRNIDFKPYGKNVSLNDVNIDCPYCGADKHLAIHKESGLMNCWVCNFEGLERRPTFLDLVQELESCTFTDAKNLLEDFIDDFVEAEEMFTYRKRKKIFLPEEADDFFNPKSIRHRNIALKYLSSRGFDDKIIKKYKLQFCSKGKFAFRIIIPVYFKNELVTFLGRDYLNRKEVSRYENCSIEESLQRPKELFYGWDFFKGDHLRLVEGVTDKWRIGDTSLAVLRSKISSEQKTLILNLKLKSISIMFDGDAYSKAYQIGEDLSPFISKVKVLDMGQKDVADRTYEKILRMERKQLLAYF